MNRSKLSRRYLVTSAKPRVFAGLSLFTGLGAVMTKSCCLLPLLLASLGLSGSWISSGATALRPYFLGIAVTTLGAGWWLALRGREAACQAHCVHSRAGGAVFVVLGISTLLVSLAVLWGWFEPVLRSYWEARV